MRRFAHMARSTRLLFALTLVASLAAMAGSAQAVVVQNSQGNSYGVALLPGTSGSLATASVPVVTSTGTCYDPQLLSTPDFGSSLPTGALCLHDTTSSDGDTVLPKNETFALTWDPNH